MRIVLLCLTFLVTIAPAVQAQNSQQAQKSQQAQNSQSVDFGRDVRPILAKHCFKCHGPDPATREAGLRLDYAEGAREDRGGYAAIVPGDSEASEVVARITSDDEDLRMPPGEPLSEQEIATLVRWIENGGRYEQHWAFVPPRRPPVPEVNDPRWCRSPIDRFILAKLQSADLEPGPPATREALVRRLYLDLCGLTPSPEQVDEFLQDDSPRAYEKLVDRLLASPAYAERFARPWLDLARYSDTNGYEKDRPRSIWPYRDWVIQAIAADMPYDQFSIEQLAGDMLPDATLQQRIATGFHRNTMLNEEGGIDPLEYRFYAMVDRVATTGTVWMGLTVGCAQCHTHKYDPITHQDYYSMFALLNQADEPDVIVQTETTRQQRKNIEASIRAAEDALIEQYLPSQKEWRDEPSPSSPVAAEFKDWLNEQIDATVQWQRVAPSELTSTMPKLEVLPDDSILASGDVTKRDIYHLQFEIPAEMTGATALRLEVLPHSSLPDSGPGMAFYEGRRGDFFLSELDVTFNGHPLRLQNPSHSYGKISVGSGSADAANVLDNEGSTGWSTSGQEGEANQWVAEFEQPITGPGTLEIEMLFERHFAAALGHFRFALTRDQSPIAASTLPASLYDWNAASSEATIDPQIYRQLQRHFVQTSDVMKPHRKELEQLKRALPETVRTLGMRQRDPEDYRTTHRHHRGEYLKPREEVPPGVPEVFPPLDAKASADRLAFAQWLVSEKNPLVARVTANRAWRALFGQGIVATDGDFGTQSQPPSHPELLDWLAMELREGGWSLKRLHRQIVLSATYRQAVTAPPASDPENKLYATFPHRRLSAEQIRDAMLSASARLSREIGGPSVYPPQPASVMQMAYGAPQWNESKGGDRYRRSLYTFSKRTAPFAAYLTFDGPTGEACLARRQTSTTPLQALTLLNDPMYLELAEGLAETTLREVGRDAEPAQIARHLFRRLLVRQPTEQELQAILQFYHAQAEHDQPWMLVARALMNTDEAITAP